ncbi:MAG: ACP S-malonyltransferase [Gammaproteobacteria bacterium]|nr:ACP S-malonyltransferase [Gammaproteobacteria bacterium]
MSLAMVFPGQGSQSIGMLKELAGQFAQVKSTFDEAASVLGYDLWHIVQHGPEEKLNSTEVTQPVMLAAGVACWRIWQAQAGKQPTLLAGHSLGEYSALVCAGSLHFSDAIRLVAARGRYMQHAVPSGNGAMAAILGLDDARVQQICGQAAQSQIVAAVNFNSPGQVVVAGHKAAVERVIVLAKENGAKRALLLPVSVPSHCELMRPAAEQLAKELDTITLNPPAIAVINNVDVAQSADPVRIREALARQLYQPVRWAETIYRMEKQGISHLVECGPGKVLLGLNKRIVKEMHATAVYDPASLAASLQAVA